MSIKTSKEIDVLREGGKRLAYALEKVKETVKVGVSTKELDDIAEKEILNSGGVPSFKNYQAFGAPKPFPSALCVSINDEVVHGMATAERILREGDIVSLDIGMKYESLYTDTAQTVGVGKLDKNSDKLINVCKKSLDEAIAEVRDGAHLGDIGFAVQSFVGKNKFGVIRQLVGHGVGHKIHEEPEIPNWGKLGQGLILSAGAVIAIEPMITAGHFDIGLLKNGWTWATKDGSRSAHFEHTLVVTKDGAEVLTML